MSMSQEGSGFARSVSKQYQQRKDTQLNVICDKFKEIGWKKKYIDRYRERFTDFDFEDERDDYWMEQELTSHYEGYVANQPESFINILCRGGFKKRVAEKLWADIIEPIYDTCYTTEQLYDIAIDYVLGKTNPIQTKSAYYLKLAKENEWTLTQVQEGTKSIYYGHVININQTDNVSEKVNKLKEIRDAKANEVLYLFHCTSWTFAKNIIEYGVSSSVGRQCLDFGIRQGFYTTENIQMAIEWGEKQRKYWKGQVAIVIFEIDAKKLKKYKTKYFNSTTNEWKQLVTHSRKCEEKENALDFFDFVYGPVCLNPKAVCSQGKAPIADKGKFQFVSKSINGDFLMRDSYIGSIFFANQM